MTTTSQTARTGYLNAITSGAFKTGKDGRKVFYPWGVLGRGYAIPSEKQYERLHFQVKVYMIVTLVLIIGLVMLSPIAGIIASAASVALFLAWLPFGLRGLEPTDEKLSLKESVTTQALAHNALTLWILALSSLGFVAGGILMAVFDPGMWMVAVPSTMFFGVCAAVMIWMLVIRRTASV